MSKCILITYGTTGEEDEQFFSDDNGGDFDEVAYYEQEVGAEADATNRAIHYKELGYTTKISHVSL